MSVLRAGRGRGGGGWGGCGGGWKFLVTEIYFFAKTTSWGPKTEGGDFGVFGAPHAPTRGSRAGRKTIHFFL